MKHSLLFLSFLFCLLSFQSHSQTVKKYSYLIVRIRNAFDNEIDKHYYRIDPEAANPNASSINNLVKYTPKLKLKGFAVMYASKNDTTTSYFNYFSTISEALQFLDEKGWQLFSIYNDIQGSFNTLNSEAVYYMRKDNN